MDEIAFQVHPGISDGYSYFHSVSESSEALLDSISSDPVRICFCRDGQSDCSYQHPPISVVKGGTFNVTIVAVNQVNHTLSAEVISSVSREGGLREGQQHQPVSINCTTLTYNLNSPHDEEHLVLYADGPCESSVISQKEVLIQFCECLCPIGFQNSSNTNTQCECGCDPELSGYIAECNQLSSSLLLRENTSAWISYMDQFGYIIHPYCPYDYCLPSTMKRTINFNMLNGSDEQCNSIKHSHNYLGSDTLCNVGRMGTLCGSCKPGYSLSFGTSECIECHGSKWYGGLIGIILIDVVAGLLLVISILSLNITVSVGTINGVIFYANVIAANNSAFFRLIPSFPSVFVAWLNLDIGFNICIIDNSNAFNKTWLELLFPMYILLVVVIIIVASKYSQRFSNLIGKKNPVATLATLILLSYTRFLRSITAMLSPAHLIHTNGTVFDTVWRPDGSISYLKGKHISLFIVAMLILCIGIPFTLILLCWHCLLKCSHKGFLRRIISTKVTSFVETYCAPFHAQHRYWTGMLLLVRVILYFIAGVEQSGNPQIQLVATFFLVGFILLIKGLTQRRSTVYKKAFADFLESLLLFNLLAFSVFMLYAGDDQVAAEVAAYLSTAITLLLVIVTVGYHVINYTPLHHNLHITGWLKIGVKKPKKNPETPLNNPLGLHLQRDVDIFDLVDDSPTTDDYRLVQEVQPELPELPQPVHPLPTATVIEISRPRQYSYPPEKEKEDSPN